MAYKKINKGGGFTIPRTMRHETGILAGVPVQIEVDDDGNGVHIRKYTPTCYFCGSAETVISFNRFEVCKKCGMDILWRFKEHGHKIES